VDWKLIEAFGSAAGIIALFVALYHWRLARDYSSLEEWALKNRFTLVKAEKNFGNGGFKWWATSRNQTVFLITVRDIANHERSGWAKLGSFWGDFPFTKKLPVQVLWKE
jgi:hypothetical protein